MLFQQFIFCKVVLKNGKHYIQLATLA